MNRNPIIPFFIIMVLGIGLMFVLSFKGLGDAEKIAAGEGEKTEEAAATPEDTYKAACLGCHGADYSGGVGPALKGLGDRMSQDQIKEILTNGTTKGMPAGLVKADQMDAMTQWLATLK